MRYGALVIVAALFAARVEAQCQGWLANGPLVVNGPIFATVMWDPDGAGPQQPWLVIGGDFTNAGGQSSNRIAAWDGNQWRSFGAGNSNGVNGPVYTLTVHNGELIAAGLFSAAGSAVVSNIARWNQSAEWRAIGPGIFSGPIFSAASYGGELWVGGSFIFGTAPGTPFTFSSIGRWSGATWSGASGYPGSECFAMVVHRGTLYTAGRGSLCHYHHAAGWTIVNPVTTFDAYALTEHNGKLAVGGRFRFGNSFGSVLHVALWDTQEGPFSTHARGIHDQSGPREVDSPVYALGSIGGRLHLGGTFSTLLASNGATPTPMRHCATWSETEFWQPFGSGTDGPVFAYARFGSEVLVGGAFNGAGGVAGPYLARWTVLAAPTIIAQPAGGVASVNGTFQLTIAASSPQGTLAYQWHHDGAPISNGPGGISVLGGVVSGANSPTLTISDIRRADGGTFACVVSNGCASVTSDDAAVTVTPICNPDFNGDGTVDQGDVAALIDTVAGGPCPD